MTTGSEGLTRGDALFILAALEKSSVQHLEIDVEGLRLVIRRGGDLPVAQSAPAVRVEEAAPRAAMVDADAGEIETVQEPALVAPSGDAILSPAAGVFYRSPAPGEPPFVEVGDTVEAGATVAIVESMKLMISVAAPQTGTVTEIRVANNGTVGFDQPLMIIEAIHE